MCNSTLPQTANAVNLWDLIVSIYPALQKLTRRITYYYGWDDDPDDLLHEQILVAYKHFVGDNPRSLAGFITKGLRFRHFASWRHHKRQVPFCHFTDDQVDSLASYTIDDDEQIKWMDEQLDQLCEDILTKTKLIVKPNSATAQGTAQLLGIFAKSVRQSQGIGVTEYDDAPNLYRAKETHRAEKAVRVPRRQILDHAAAEMGINAYSVSDRLEHLRKATQHVLAER
ncbi:MAG: hypothetical protein HY868_16715 [Chloroflexi bacterium]|nr:hypothetical protein [Chloroflexota bacterium]